ncbi:hypothetical protein XENORESO_021428 [Xenotaenia resolanae]|uniref:Uncharacterized protein n=1 Tax=Xenotaenia resolanae TaxID=208358 RepID=A0ABV0VTS5_9TELE
MASIGMPTSSGGSPNHPPLCGLQLSHTKQFSGCFIPLLSHILTSSWNTIFSSAGKKSFSHYKINLYHLRSYRSAAINLEESSHGAHGL